MSIRKLLLCLLLIAPVCSQASAENWNQHRGPRQDGVTAVANLPLKWDAETNVAWRRELPGPGTSSPVVWDGRIFVTAFSGYDLDKRTNPDPKDTSSVGLHVLCFDATSGRQLWDKSFKPDGKLFPAATSPMKLHGYATNTPAADAQAVYAAFGNGGLFALSHDGELLWRSSLGSETHRWGSGASVVLYKDLVIANADIESHALIAYDRRTGRVVWRQTHGLPQGEKKTWHNGYSWSTPVVVEADGRTELILLSPGRINACDPDTGSPLWDARTTKGYAMATPIAHDGIVYAIMGSSHCVPTSVAYRAGQVDGKREIWRQEETGCAVSMPVLLDQRLYWATFHGGLRSSLKPAGFCCLDPADGELIYRRIPEGTKLQCRNDEGIYACALGAPGRIYYVTQTDGTYVVATGDEFKILAHNTIAGDESNFNASPVPLADGRLLLRSDKAIYCIGRQSR